MRARGRTGSDRGRSTDWGPGELTVGHPGRVAARFVLFLMPVLPLAACTDARAPMAPAASEEASGSTGLQGAVVPVKGFGGPFTVATDINDHLQVVGSSETQRGKLRAFLWEEGEIRSLGTLGGSWSTAADVNDWGQVTGTSVTANGLARAFFWADGDLYELGTLGGLESHGVAINDRGEVAGYSTTASGEVHAFLWSHGRMIDLGTLGGAGSFTAAVNDAGIVVGKSLTGVGGQQAFYWSDGSLKGLSPGSDGTSSAVEITEGNDVLINTRGDGRSRAYLWRDGALVPLGGGGGTRAVAVDVNDRGQAVGQVTGESGETRAVVWSGGEARTIRFEDRSHSSTAMAINDGGSVVGAVRPGSESGQRAFLNSRGRVWTLSPDRMPGAPDQTTGIDVTESGAVLGVANYESGRVRSFVWRPAAGPSTRGRVDTRGARPGRRNPAATGRTEPGERRNDSQSTFSTARILNGARRAHPPMAVPRSLQVLARPDSEGTPRR